MALEPLTQVIPSDTTRLWEHFNRLITRINALTQLVENPPDTGWVAHGGTLAAAAVEVDPIQYRVRDGVCYWRGRVSPSSTWTGATINTLITNLPVAVRPSVTGVLTCSVDSGSGSARVHSDGTFVFTPQGSTSSWPQFGGSYPLG